MKKITKKNILLSLLGVFLILQVFSIDKSLPETIDSEDFFKMENVPLEVSSLLRRACKDCHSHQTDFPWYTNIEPLSWWINGHIEFGRENLNFSKWNSYDAVKKRRKIDECIEVLQKRRMPFKSYKWLHDEAKLSEAEYESLILYFQSIR